MGGHCSSQRHEDEDFYLDTDASGETSFSRRGGGRCCGTDSVCAWEEETPNKTLLEKQDAKNKLEPTPPHVEEVEATVEIEKEVKGDSSDRLLPQKRKRNERATSCPPSPNHWVNLNFTEHFSRQLVCTFEN